VLQDVSTDVPISPKVHFSLHEVLGCAEVHTMKEIIDSYSLIKLYTRQPGSKLLENTLKLLEKLAMLEQCGQIKAALESLAGCERVGNYDSDYT
jgi:hypothetical protein